MPRSGERDPLSLQEPGREEGEHDGGLGFAAALAKVTQAGFAFGGGSPSEFGANGVATTSGTASFQVNSYTISAP